MILITLGRTGNRPKDVSFELRPRLQEAELPPAAAILRAVNVSLHPNQALQLQLKLMELQRKRMQLMGLQMHYLRATSL